MTAWLVAAATALTVLAPGCGADDAQPRDDEPDTGPVSAAPAEVAAPERLEPPAYDPDLARYEFGIHLAGKYDPAGLQVCGAGSTTILAELGTQHAWMFVLGARTDQLPVGTERVKAAASLVDVDGTVYGTFEFAKRPTFQGPDGLSYIMNLFLVVPSHKSWVGRDAMLWLSIEDEAGFIRLKRTAPVHLEAP